MLPCACSLVVAASSLLIGNVFNDGAMKKETQFVKSVISIYIQSQLETLSYTYSIQTNTTPNMLTVLENCRVSPPPATVGEKSLPLTFFDIIWTTFFPIHQVFFYESSHSKQRFLETIVPNLKHSLSITLQHFFPFASNLIVFPNQTKKKTEIRHLEGDSVSVSFTECNLDFNDLKGNQPRNCDIFHPLVPPLGSAIKESDYLIIPLFSVKVTLFPNSGIAIGLTNHHSLCDATTRFNFLKAWSSISKHGTDDLFLASGALPLYDRVIKYPISIDEFCLSLPVLAINDEFQPPHLVSDVDKVRATIVLTQAHINRLKKWASSQLPTLDYISSFSVACAYTWSCIAKSRVHIGEEIKKGDDEDRFICAVDWRSRLDPPIPQTYFGNCVGGCITETTRTTLLASNKGFVTAVELFGKALKETLSKKNGVIVDVERWTKRAFEPVPTIGVSGTPKTKVYDVDFGWGKPKKHETISIDYNGSISVNACKDSSADIEIGLSLPAKQMDVFMSVHKDELESTYFAE